jgi:hypothetical protein
MLGKVVDNQINNFNIDFVENYNLSLYERHFLIFVD